MSDGATSLVHGTCVALGRTSALIRGPSGSGKSDLALRFLFLARRGPAAVEAPILVSDDQVQLTRRGTRIVATAPPTIRGKLEVRGIGIVDVKTAPEADVALLVDLCAPADVERLPDWREREAVLGVPVPVLRLTPFEPSAPIKLAAAVAWARKLWE